MNRKRILVLFLAMMTFAALLFASQALSGSRALDPVCPLPGAYAQEDNPCLPQEATISAMQVVLLQSTLDAQNYQATITALEDELQALKTSGGAELLPTLVPGLPFVENFDDNLSRSE